MTTFAWVFLIITILMAWTGLGFYWIIATAFLRSNSWYDTIIILPAACIMGVISWLATVYRKLRGTN